MRYLFTMTNKICASAKLAILMTTGIYFYK